jgi:hypothetical protein
VNVSEDEILSRFPELLSQSKENPLGVEHWGIECFSGWYPLVDKMCRQIQAHINNEKTPQVTITRIKEKFGCLRVSYTNGDQYVRGIVDMTQAISGCICEICGDAGYPQKTVSGWVKCICDSCLKKLDDGI